MPNNPMRLLHALHRRLSSQVPIVQEGLFRHHTLANTRVQMLIRAFYAFLFFLTLLLIPEWEGIMGRPDVLPLWPVFWLKLVPLHLGIEGIMFLYTGGSLLAAALPQWRTFRILAFLGVFQFWAFNNSFGKIGHSLHWMVLVSFILIFLPKGWHHAEQGSRLIRQTTLLTFWAAQATIAITYSMAGLLKIILGCYQFVLGQPSLFRVDALARHVAERLLQTNSHSWLGGWLIDHPWLSWPMFLGTVYLELFLLLTVFRPRLQLTFVVGLVLFHVCSYLSMTIIFPQNCFLLFLFFAGMPLLRGTWKWADFLLDFPILGAVWVLWKKRAS